MSKRKTTFKADGYVEAVLVLVRQLDDLLGGIEAVDQRTAIAVRDFISTSVNTRKRSTASVGMVS